MLAPKPGSLIVDGTCGGGGHTEALLRAGADVLALDQDPDAVQHVSEQLARFGRARRRAAGEFSACASAFSTSLGFARSAVRFSIWVSLRGNSKMRSAVSASCETARSICAWIHGIATDCCHNRKRVQRRTIDPLVSRTGGGTGCASYRELDRKDAKDCTVSRNSAAGPRDRKSWLAGTVGVIRPRKFFKRCGWK